MPTEVLLVKAMVFPVVMYACWTIYKAEHRRTNAFELWCQNRLLSPLDCKIKPVNPKRNQYWILIRRTDAEVPIFWPPDVKNWLIGKTLMLGKIEGRRRGWQRMRWLDSTTSLIYIRWRKLWEVVMDREAGVPGAVHGVTKSWIQWATELTRTECRRHRCNPWLRRSPGEGNGNSIQYSCLGNPVDRGAWHAPVHGV